LDQLLKARTLDVSNNGEAILRKTAPLLPPIDPADREGLPENALDASDKKNKSKAERKEASKETKRRVNQEREEAARGAAKGAAKRAEEGEKSTKRV